MRFLRLTPPAVKKLAVGESISEHGITVRKLDGDERWTIEFMFHRQRVHRILGLTSQGWTRSLCEARIQEIKSEILAGTSSLPKGRKTHLRVSDLADWYVEEMEATHGKNLKAKRRHLKQHIKPRLGNVVADKLRDAEIGRYVKARLDDEAEAATINRELATLNHMLSTAYKRGKLIQPAHRITKLTEELTPRTPLSDGDLAKLRRAAIKDIDPRIALFIELAIDTSMRQSEVGRAKFSDIQWDRRRLILWRAKAGRRYQPLSSRIVELLREEQSSRPEGERDGWIFPARSKTGHVNQFNKVFRRVVISAGLSTEQVTPHLLRHTAVTRLAERGVPVSVIQQISGHKTAAMVHRYTHNTDPAVDAAMRVLEDANTDPSSYTGVTQDESGQAVA